MTKLSAVPVCLSDANLCILNCVFALFFYFQAYFADGNKVNYWQTIFIIE